ncbi:MAG: D-glycero-beta-D-manno-heptose 1-phosphate adenylyltransferase [marine benthic group bacterium]|nr:D-glycero-beta-D-manno-heptose 1-phosphate adenylyltransferase [Gemmatimonadota bacterium]
MTAELDRYEDSSSRVLSIENLIRRYARPRDYRLVFSNGVFDLLHSGHVSSLEAARGCGDRLVVAVNSDSSTRRLKGPGRPLQAAGDRARVVAALRCVDAVTIFPDDTPAALIERLLPDVLVKGADYRVEQIAGAEAVLKAGGEVRLIELEVGRSTSDLIERARGAALREPGSSE